MNDSTQHATGSFVQHLGETYYRISNVEQMPTFFMSLVSSADHWLFIASNGGLTAGRINAESALFPYETEDKIAAHSEQTGSKTIVRVQRGDAQGKHFQLWEPFSSRYAGLYQCERHLYKNVYGDKLIFEEVNHDLQLTLRMAWRTSDRFGFVRTCWLHNDGDDGCQIELLDGLQNLLPYGATTSLQTSFSSLLNAYKRNELDSETGLGIFALSATLTDQAEPSESLKATTAWQVGLDKPTQLLCMEQVDGFRYGRSLTPEHDILGKAGAYFISSTFELAAGQQKQWHIVAEVNQDSSAITKLTRFLHQEQAVIEKQIKADIVQGTAVLLNFVAAADGLQSSAEETTSAHHFANVLFNIMRGGIFANGYQVEKDDLGDFLQVRNRPIFDAQSDWFANLPAQMSVRELYDLAGQTGEPDLIRLCYEYLPLTFSRRHGDPSRPWNQFSINLKKPDGSANLDYQGNWRDIFQNWEPLALAFPAYTEGLIAKFLNATTADGYNPYRVTRDGIEWEVPEPDNPWANIGYWSDHQIIYLQKLLEIAEQVHPGMLAQLWEQPIFAYANVPYRQKPYQEMLTDWYNTIDFDWDVEAEVETAVSRTGTDGRLLLDADKNVIHVTMVEKLLVLLLAKLTNLVPEGGIWMNTQRPEWNDANNALVGKGLSVVTTAYLRRFIAFWQAQLQEVEGTFVVNTAVSTLLNDVQTIFMLYQPNLENGFTDEARRRIMDDLGTAVTNYRATIYQEGISTTQAEITASALRDFLALAQTYIEQTLQANWRTDGLAHTYNILRLDEQGAAVENLYLMLEGQVAILSSGMLASDEALALLQNLRESDLYRADQHSYMLYPNRKLPGFLQKNNVSAEQVADSSLVQALAAAGDIRLLVCDEADVYHFNGRFRNAGNVNEALDKLAQKPAYTELVAAERDFILELFEATFDHHAFTGRSGTFFGYEGLGSVYWHMVSKLLLAAQEYYQQAVSEGANAAVIDALNTAYYDIRAGIGFNKTPDVYGAFPTDPYSHTPMGSGARQPGMTGQVKEEILTRLGELGVSMHDGKLCFTPTLLRKGEFLQNASTLSYVNIDGDTQSLSLPPDSLAFTICQTPVVYKRGEKEEVEVVFRNGRSTTMPNNCLDNTTTQHIFNRDGQVQLVRVTVRI
ncbi:MAG: hypothetical protein DWQ04_04530 [Chloroflexi bacterium]|nr:MAG: hypothetical protein DWQ04_04530 [Chloroflexota bacterium]